jgi:epoxide hydrolase 4
MATDKWESIYVSNGPVQLHAKVAGSANGPLVLLLHGFPEFWYGWRNQIEPLAAAGYRVVVPDQRGYNRSSKPLDVGAYDISLLVDDAVAVIRSLGYQRAFVIGHDWGGLVAWTLAALHPEHVERVAILNVPHPAVFRSFALRNPRQLLRSWYVFYFQLPWIPEQMFAAKSFRAGCEALTRTSRANTFTAEDLELYREAWSHPGAVRSMVHWYRAFFRRFSAAKVPNVHVPLLLLWGRRDAFLLPGLAEESLQRCSHAQLIAFEQASHWLQHEEPEAVNDTLLHFFASSASVQLAR